MDYDIFLSHSTRDLEHVRQVKFELEALGRSVFIDYEALPLVAPQEVTEETAEALRTSMRRCRALVYVISASAKHSRWMPWEIGYFDGCNGQVFVYPVDNKAQSHAKGIEYLKIYPIVPLQGRRRFLDAHLPRARDLVGPMQAHDGPPGRHHGKVIDDALFKPAHHAATADFGGRLMKDAPQMFFDPSVAWRISSEMIEAWWRLWDMAPPPSRQVFEDGRWPKR